MLLSKIKRLALVLAITFFVKIIILLFTSKLLGTTLIIDDYHGDQTGQCQGFDFDNMNKDNNYRPDDVEIVNGNVCITHVEKNCFNNVSKSLLEMISKFTNDQSQVRCDHLIDVGEGDPKSPPANGQYPYKLCKQWLPNPNNCIVYSFG